MDGASCFVFDGTRDFCLWRARVESELISRGLLGFVLVRGYNGTQAFAYKGKQMQPKPHEALSDTEALEKENEAITCLRRFLHPTVEAQIANRNAYECWATLYALYGSGKTTDINDMYRALTRTWFGEKKDETMDRFVTRWKMMVQQFEQATGAEQADSVKSAMFVDTLPASWRPLVTNWQGARPITPYAELLDKVSVEAKRRNTESLAESGRSRPTSSSHAPPERGEQPNGADKCFYCFRSNHWYRQCKYLLGDIEKGKTHSQSAYSYLVS
ncbi:uncharacterized protein IUM83_16130 [Phytophthora cinnamomi]|uniref:uncharacterized protein n=1 Tax=Phytophthora cinnamomi TaxID=4785 RepID=UPI00355A0464|nr:hypothetical protein IUM83_16130 [Phytophthora cinnamomi]